MNNNNNNNNDGFRMPQPGGAPSQLPQQNMPLNGQGPPQNGGRTSIPQPGGVPPQFSPQNMPLNGQRTPQNGGRTPIPQPGGVPPQFSPQNMPLNGQRTPQNGGRTPIAPIPQQGLLTPNTRPISPNPQQMPMNMNSGSNDYINGYYPNGPGSSFSNSNINISMGDSSMRLLPTMSNSNSSIHLNEDDSYSSLNLNGSASPIIQKNKKINQKKTIVKKVQLYKGNYIVNCPVPDGVLRKGVFGREIEEFGYLRYSAVTCDPNDFEKCNFTLRQRLWKRQTELFIVLTMYNEDEILFARSMSSVMENITYMCNKDKKWGMDGWKKVIVCIVSDGRQKINKRVLDMLEFMGVYQESVMKEKVNEKEVQAHVFEYTTQVFLDTKMNDKGATDNYLPVQLLFCLKEKNKKKINSHRWFFNAFGKILNPNVCVLIDVGTRPTSTSIHSLWKAFDKDKHIAGACGEIKCDLGKHWKNLLNPLVATQHFEYKMSNILDKPLESMFGYISVLPGAFSAYRYSALQGQPLEAYFKGETLHERPDGSLFKSNMYLAEDRILCFELVAKKGAKYLLKYVSAAKAETDVPDSIPEFISQRRRWLNGSFFASLYSSYNWLEVYKTDHSLYRKIIFGIEFVYNVINLLFSWFGLSNFFLIFYFLANSVLNNSVQCPSTKGYSVTLNYLNKTTDYAQIEKINEYQSYLENCGNNPVDNSGDSFSRLIGEYGSSLFIFMEALYGFAIIEIFICSLGNRPQGSRLLYLGCIILFAIVMLFLLILSFYTIYQVIDANRHKSFTEIFQNSNLISMFFSLLATYGLYFISSFLHLQPAHMFTSFVQYMLLLPSFVNILMVYAFCNTHDVSWGTKGSTEDASSKLGSVTAKPGDTFHIELPTKEDINSHYEKLLPELKKEKVEESKPIDQGQIIQDGKQNFRTYMVLFWIFCNFLLLIIVLAIFDNDYLLKNGNFNPYLTFVFLCVLFLSTVRFIGSTLYLVEQILM